MRNFIFSAGFDPRFLLFFLINKRNNYSLSNMDLELESLLYLGIPLIKRLSAHLTLLITLSCLVVIGGSRG